MMSINTPTHITALFIVGYRQFLKRLNVFDQRALVVVAERRLLLEVTGAEIVSAIDHEVWTLTYFQQWIDEICEHLASFFIVIRMLLQILLHFQQQIEDLLLMRQLVLHSRRLAEQIDVGQKIDRCARRNRAYHDAIVAKQPWEETLPRTHQRS